MATEKDRFSAAMRSSQNKAMRRQIAAFFTELQREEPSWPAVSQELLIDGLADALLDMGKASGKGSALLQTLIYELQERLNANLKA